MITLNLHLLQMHLFNVDSLQNYKLFSGWSRETISAWGMQMNRFKSLSHPLWFWTVSWFHAVSEGDYVSTSINRKWLWRIVSHDPIYTKKIDDLNVHFVPVTRYHYLVSNLRLTNTYLPCEQDFTNCNQFCTMWKYNNMWTYFHNEFFPMYQSNSKILLKLSSKN